MSINIYDKSLGKWIPQETNVAKNIRVYDTDGNFVSLDEDGKTVRALDNVEECLADVKTGLDKLSDRVEYIYENGTIGGGGGGGGGGYTPSLSLLSDPEMVVEHGKDVIISISFTSPNSSEDGSATISITNKTTGSVTKITHKVAQGAYDINLGQLADDKYNISIIVTDSTNRITSPINISVLCGGLSVQSDFTGGDYSLSDDIQIVYTVNCNISDSCDMVLTLRDAYSIITTEKLKRSTGTFTWDIGKLAMGTYIATITAKSGTISITPITYSLTILNSASMYISSTFEGTVEYGTNALIPYRISKTGYNDTYSYITVYRNSINDNNVYKTYPKLETHVGLNYLTLSNLPIGTYIVSITAETSDGVYNNFDTPCNITITVSSSFNYYTSARESNLIAFFDATNGDNNNGNTESRDTWINEVEGSNITCKLYNFNFADNSSGWDNINGELKFESNAYAIIDYQPFKDNLSKTGEFTFDIYYKVDNVGNFDARVMDCMMTTNPYCGMMIDTRQAKFITNSKPITAKFCDISTTDEVLTTYDNNGNVVTSPEYEDYFVRQTFVFNKNEGDSGYMYIYLNGVPSAIVNNITSDTFLAMTNKIYLGASLSGDGEIVNTANCSIKSIRIYDVALTGKEIVYNSIADVKNKEKQLALRNLNMMDDNSVSTTPVMTITFPSKGVMETLLSGTNDSINATGLGIKYIDPNDTAGSSKSFELENNCVAYIQGTSSATYPVKNFTIYLYDESGRPFFYQLSDNSTKEYIFTLKTDYMDFSHANNISTVKFANDLFRNTTWNRVPNIPEYGASLRDVPMVTPPQLLSTNNTVNTCIDGHPIILQFYCKDTGKTEFAGVYNFNFDRNSLLNYGFIAKYENTTEIYNGLPADFDATYGQNCYAYEVAINSGSGSAGGFGTSDWNSVVTCFKYRHHPLGRATVTYTDATTHIERLNGQSYHQELINLLNWVSTYKDNEAEWLENFPKRFSFRHALDYYILAYVFGMIDNLAKNTVIATWGNEGGDFFRWYFLPYDCDSMLGLNNSGVLDKTPDIDMTSENGFEVNDSVIWSSFAKYYKTAIEVRYAELRELGIFSASNYFSYMKNNVFNVIGRRYYNDDADAKYITFKNDPVQNKVLNLCIGTREEYTKRWLRDRFVYMDSIMNYGGNLRDKYGTSSTLVVRTNLEEGVSSKQVTFAIKPYAPQMLKVRFTSADDSLVSVRASSEDIENNNFVYITGTINVANNNDLTIYGAGNIRYLEGIENLNLSHIWLQDATRLVEFRCEDSANLEAINMPTVDTPMLQKFVCTDCPKLGTIQNLESLDLSKFTGLRHVDISNTSIKSITVNTTVLEDIKCDNTLITSFNLANNNYLQEISVNNCESLHNLYVDNNKELIRISVEDCSNLAEINVTNCQKLSDFDLSSLQKLTTINFVNDGLENITLLKYPLLKNINIQTCNSLHSINFLQTDLAYTNENLINTFDIIDCHNLSTIIINRMDFNTQFTGVSSIDTDKNTMKDGTWDLSNCTGLLDFEFNGYRVTGLRRLILPYTLTKLNILWSNPKIPVGNSVMHINARQLVYSTSGTNINDFQYSGNGVDLRDFINLENTDVCIKGTAVEDIVIDSLTIENADDLSNLESFSGLNIFNNANLKTINGHIDFTGTSLANVTLSSIYDMTLSAPNVTDATGLFSDAEQFTPQRIKDVLATMPLLENATRLFANRGNIIKFADDTLKYNTKITITDSMFANCGQLTTIANMKLKTNNVTSMKQMFLGCTSLTAVPVLNISKVVNMEYMYKDCVNLQYIPEDNLVLTNVVNIIGLCSGCNMLLGYNDDGVIEIDATSATSLFEIFSGCNLLTSITILNSENVTNTSSAFKDCTSITTSPVLDMQNVVDASSMLKNCTKLTSVQTYTTSKVENFNEFFYGCTALAEIPELDTSKCTSMKHTFYNCRLITTIPTLNTSLVTDMSYCFADCIKLSALPNIDTSKVESMESMFDGCLCLVSLPTNFNSSSVVVVDNMFAGCSVLTTIPVIDVSKCTTMIGMFRECSSLVSLPTGFNTSNITSMNSIFYGCSSLLTMPDFDTSSVENMDNMYGKCMALAEISDTFNTSNAQTMKSTFAFCTTLTHVPILQTSNVMYMNSLFENCKNIESVELFDTSSVLDMSGLFKNCQALISVPLFNTSNVKSMAYMFRGCTSLVDVPNFNTNNVKQMSGMFNDCASLVAIPSFNTLNVTTFDNMFAGCTSLIDIPYFDTRSAINMSYMFQNCKSLTGIKKSDIYDLDISLSQIDTDIIDITNIQSISACTDNSRLTLHYTADDVFYSKIYKKYGLSFVEDAVTLDYQSNSISSVYKFYNNFETVVFQVTGTTPFVVFQQQIMSDETVTYNKYNVDTNASMPNGTITHIEINNTCSKIAITHTSSPYISVYDISDGSNIVSLPNPDNLPSAVCKSCVFSDDGQYLFVSCTASPYLLVYAVTDTAFSLLTDIVDVAPNSSSNICITSSNYTMVNTSSTPFVAFYKLNTDNTLQQLQTSLNITSSITNMTFSHDGSMLAVLTTSSPYFYLYTRKDDDFILVDTTDILLTAPMKQVIFTYDDNDIALISDQAPNILYYHLNIVCTHREDKPNIWNTNLVSNFTNMFEEDINLLRPVYMQYNNATDVSSMFYNCSKLTAINDIVTDNIGYMSNTFYMCSSLIYLPTINFENMDNFTNALYGCANLQSVSFEGKIAMEIDLTTNNLLPHDTLLSIINLLITLSPDDPLNLYLGSNANKLTTAELKIATDKNWTIIGG